MRTERGLAVRLDRLSRRAHRHHRFAHHPVCDGYATESIRLGRYHVCRGCTAAALGALGGLALGPLPQPPVPVVAFLALLGMGVGLLGLAYRLPFGGKLVTRALPAAAAGLVIAEGLRRGDVLGLAAAVATVALVGLGVRLYRRRGPTRTPCTTCRERARSPCSGFERTLRRERAFQRLAARCIDTEAHPRARRGHRPPSVQAT